MPNWSTIIYDELIWHKIQIVRYERKALAGVVLAHRDMIERLPGALSVQPHIRNIQQAAAHFAQADAMRLLKGYGDMAEHVVREAMEDAFEQMTVAAYRSMREASPLAMDLVPWARIPEEHITQIYKTQFMKTNLEQWKNTFQENQLKEVQDQFAQGLIAGESVDEMARRLKDALGYSLTSARAMARTSINAVANRGLDNIYEANKDIIWGTQYTATLDISTCEICGGYDGTTYKMGSSKPHTPAHINCRCLYVPIMKSAKSIGLGPLQLPKGVRASMDGQVPATEFYPEWFKRQPAARQLQILGKKKYELYQRGEFKFEQYDRCARNVDLTEIYFPGFLEDRMIIQEAV